MLFFISLLVSEFVFSKDDLDIVEICVINEMGGMSVVKSLLFCNRFEVGLLFVLDIGLREVDGEDDSAMIHVSYRVVVNEVVVELCVGCVDG